MIQKRLGIAAAVAVLLFLAFAVFRWGGFWEQALLPAVADNPEAVAQISLVQGDKVMTLARTPDNGWVIASAANAPAKTDKADAFLASLAALKSLRDGPAKTPTNSKLLGLDPPLVRILVQDKAGQSMAALDLGNPAPGDKGQRYAFVAGQEQISLIKDITNLDLAAATWTTLHLPRLALDRIRSVRILHADGDVIAFARNTPKDAFVVAGSASLAQSPQITAAASTLANWTFEGFSSANDISWPGASMLFFDTFDGMTITLLAKAKGPDVWVRVNAHTTSMPSPSSVPNATAEAKSINALRHYAFKLPHKLAGALIQHSADVQKGVRN